MLTGNIHNKDNVSIYMGGSYNSENNNSVFQNMKGQLKKVSIYAGELKMMGKDSVAKRTEQARKQAAKTIMDQFTRDIKVDDNIQMRRQNQIEMTAKADKAYEEVKKIQSMKQEIKDSYGITDDCQEQKDLELLKKSMNTPEDITEKEEAQLKDMGLLSDYQKGMLEYDAMEEVWQQRAYDALEGISSEDFVIQAIKQAALKVHPMLDAEKEAAIIMEEARKNAIAMLYEQAKDHIDEKLDEQLEKAGEVKEEMAKDSEMTEDVNRTKITEKNMWDIAKDQSIFEREIKEIIEEYNIVLEDLKGIAVNQII